MNKIFSGLLTILISTSIFGQIQKVSVVSDDSGQRLVVDGKDFIVNGINWDYVPIGTDVLTAKFWEKSDDVIKAGLDEEMALWQNMGVNAIRTYIGMPPKWITYIYENFGIYTMINSQFGAYGLTIDGVWNPQTDYADPKVKKHLVEESLEMAKMYKDTPGLLLFMLGNENNYHLTWEGAETDTGVIISDKDEAKRLQARAMYGLFNQAAVEMKKLGLNTPVGMCNGDLLYLDIVADECTDIDIYGTNMYRGVSFVDAFDRIKNELGKPVLFTEFGADAYNARDNKEDQYSQAYYMVGNWKEIYENAAGLGKAQNSLGGFTFQSSDGWWKSGFNDREDADTHQTKANWPSNGYSRDQAKENDPNMNEEWFGICAKGPTSTRGLYTLYPRASYYALQKAHRYNPYAEDANRIGLITHFDDINLMDAVLRARGDKAIVTGGGDSQKIKLSRLSANFTSFSTGGSLISTPDNPDATQPQVTPNQLGFDHMQSFFIGAEAKPAPNVRAEVVFNAVGNVARNPIDEIFYETITRPLSVDPDTNDIINRGDRVTLYQAEAEWNAKEFDLRAFYRTGHYHWGYEGDFFGLYPEANYGPNLDIYGGEILGAEIDGKGAFEGLKAAIGPQLWWGANPTMLFKYQKKLGNYDVTGIYHRDFETEIILDDSGRRVLDQNQVRSGIIPAFPTERATLVVERELGKFDIMVGGIWAGSPLNGSTFQDVIGEPGNYTVIEDKVKSSDNWGGKFKIMYEGGKFNWYGQAAYMGLVANGGADQTQTFTGWKLKDTGSGNQANILSGFTFNMGDFQIAPNFLYQKPLVAPMPNDVGGAGRLRNFIDDPFAVRWNRETTAGEILFTYDPTPGTWMYQWDNDRAEDAKFAMNLGFVYRRLPTQMDAHIGFLATREFFAFPNSAPAEDLWEIHSRMVSKISSDLGLIGNFYYGNGQANGDSERLIKRFGADIRGIYKNFSLTSHVKVNDWGPFDYHRDFNLTYPLQLMLDLSFNVGKPDWFILPTTKIGIRGTWRSLDEFSNRFAPVTVAPNTFPPIPPLSPVGFPNGSEWEIRTYIHINVGK